MSKRTVFSLAELLRPMVSKKDIKYSFAIPMLVLVACTLFKLTYGASLQIIGVLHPSLMQTKTHFKLLCALSNVVGAIDGIHVSIAKLKYGAMDYFYYKTGGFNLNCQVVVDSKQCFLDLFLEMPSRQTIHACYVDLHFMRRLCILPCRI